MKLAILFATGWLFARTGATPCLDFYQIYAGPNQQKICFQVSQNSGVLCLGSSVPSVARIEQFVNVTGMGFAFYATCAQNTQGQVSCIGNNIGGDLGLGLPHSNYYYYPTRALKLHSGLSVSAISGNGQGFCVVYTTGQASCWGYPDPLGDGEGYKFIGYSPKTMGDALPFVDVGTGLTIQKIVSLSDTNCALLNHGKVKCWGQCNDGECDYESSQTTYVGMSPNQMGDALPFIPLPSNAVLLAAGALHVCAVLDDGSAVCWGKGGPLGLDSSQSTQFSEDESSDFQLPRVRLTGTITDLAAGYQFTCVIIAGQVKCFGLGTSGQLGYGDGLSRGQGQHSPYNMAGVDSSFVPIASSAVHIVCSSGAVAVLLDNNHVQVWGAGLDLAEPSGPSSYNFLAPAHVEMCTPGPTPAPFSTAAPISNQCGHCLDPHFGAQLPKGCIPQTNWTKAQCSASATMWSRKQCRLASFCSLPTSPVVWLPSLVKKSWSNAAKKACATSIYSCQFFANPVHIPCPSLCTQLSWTSSSPTSGCTAKQYALQPGGSCVVQ